jgi:4-hydroxy-2-oxoheptanedioate aldolase
MNDTASAAAGRGSALKRLRAGKPVFGVVQIIPAPTLTELAIWSGYDFVILDCQYGVIDEAAQLGSLQVIARSDAFAVVRVKPGDLGSVSRYLDFGADAILLPDVHTQKDAADFVAAATHGPNGTRSSTGSGARAARYGLKSTPEEQPLLFAMIESAQGVKNIAAIAGTPGLHGLIIGPHDLSADLGSAGDFSTPAYMGAFAAVEQAARQTGLILGSGVHAGFDVERLVGAGHGFIQITSDVMALREGLRAHLPSGRVKP